MRSLTLGCRRDKHTERERQTIRAGISLWKCILILVCNFVVVGLFVEEGISLVVVICLQLHGCHVSWMHWLCRYRYRYCWSDQTCCLEMQYLFVHQTPAVYPSTQCSCRIVKCPDSENMHTHTNTVCSRHFLATVL